MHFKSYYQAICKNHGRFFSLFYFLLAIVHLMTERCFIFFIKIFSPVNKNIVVFRSNPDYSDNARALAEYMTENSYPYRIYFDVDDRKSLAKTVKGVVFFSSRAKLGNYKLRSIRLLLTAGFLMSTHEMILAKKYARKEQLLVRLWHGCSFKDRSRQDGKAKRSFDMALVAGELFVKTKAYFWNVEEKFILPIGYPRYDWLRMKDEKALLLLNSFKNNIESKVVIWMPTYRVDKRGRCTESNSLTQFPIINDISKWKELDTLCSDNNIVLLVKLHPFQTEYGIPFNNFTNIKYVNNQVFDDSDVPMYKFIALTDALISDYSSIAVDYLIVNHPMAFTLDDYEEYKRTRGFVFEDPRIYMPGHHLYQFNDLKNFLLDVSEGRDPYIEQRKKMYGQVIYISDHYCKELLNKLGIYK